MLFPILSKCFFIILTLWKDLRYSNKPYLYMVGLLRNGNFMRDAFVLANGCLFLRTTKL